MSIMESLPAAHRELAEALLHITVALGAGGLIGLERSFHGRPAGFRTHALRDQRHRPPRPTGRRQS